MGKGSAKKFRVRQYGATKRATHRRARRWAGTLFWLRRVLASSYRSSISARMFAFFTAWPLSWDTSSGWLGLSRRQGVGSTDGVLLARPDPGLTGSPLWQAGSLIALILRYCRSLRLFSVVRFPCWLVSGWSTGRRKWRIFLAAAGSGVPRS